MRCQSFNLKFGHLKYRQHHTTSIGMSNSRAIATEDSQMAKRQSLLDTSEPGEECAAQ